MTNSLQNIVIFGGTGFVGSNIAETLWESTSNAKVSCVSRSGTQPIHLHGDENAWANSVNWLSCDINANDALEQVSNIVAGADAVIIAVGSPPLPTFSKVAYDKQYRSNGAGNMTILEACARHKPKHIVIIGAAIPAAFRRQRFAYYQGKHDLIQCAEDLFANSETQVSILYPSVIYGRRHTRSGHAVPLGALRYLAKALQCLPHENENSTLASVAALAPISVKTLARSCVSLLMKEAPSENTNPLHLHNQAMLDGHI